MALGFTVLTFMWWKKSKACCQCLLLSHALMTAVYVTTFATNFSVTSLKRKRTCCHWLAFSHALRTALYTIRFASKRCICSSFNNAIAWFHFCAFSHALMAALKVIKSLWDPKAVKIDKANCQQLAFSKALATELWLILNGLVLVPFSNNKLSDWKVEKADLWLVFSECPFFGDLGLDSWNENCPK